MKYNLCTLFDKNYLYYGLALHSSLLKHCPKFKLWILCMDDICYEVLDKLALQNVELIKLSDIENKQLLRIKSERSIGEYCWTLSSYLTNYLLENNSYLENIGYIDSDIYFYSSPKPIYDELGNNSILIIPHNYTKIRQYQTQLSGIYNVSFVIFKNDDNGRNCLQDWSDDCLKWCYNRYEDGKFGDQKYLDYWPEKYGGVHILKHKGANLAPWNVNRYNVHSDHNNVMVDDDELIFYHFHTFKVISYMKFQNYISAYKISKHIVNLIYNPYIIAIQSAMTAVDKAFPDYKHGLSKAESYKDCFIGKIKRFLLFFRLLR